jgi:hypothetical protein
MGHVHISVDTVDVAEATATFNHHHVRRPGAGLRSNQCRQSLYRVLLTCEDLRLIQACSTWICRLQPEPDIRARFAHLEQQLAGARPEPVPVGAGPRARSARRATAKP